MRRETILQKAWGLYRRHSRWVWLALFVKALIGIAIMGYLLIEARADIAVVTARQAQMVAQQERVEQLVSAVAPLRAMWAMAERFERAAPHRNLNLSGSGGPQSGRWKPTDATLVVATIYRCAREYKIDEHLIEAIIIVESARQNDAVSPKGARGLMQLMPAHLAAGEDPHDPVLNIEKGTAYIAQCIRKCGGNTRLGLYRYHGSDPRKPLQISIEYADAVLAQWTRLRML